MILRTTENLNTYDRRRIAFNDDEMRLSNSSLKYQDSASEVDDEGGLLATEQLQSDDAATIDSSSRPLSLENSLTSKFR